MVREARLTRRCDGWTERTAREFACDCAERVVHLCDDPRPREEIARIRAAYDPLTLHAPRVESVARAAIEAEVTSVVQDAFTRAASDPFPTLSN